MVDQNINASETAYEQIRKMILKMELTPGCMLSDTDLSRNLGISRTPIREALSKLEAEGLVVNENRKKRVYILTVREANEIFDLKIAIEPYMAYLAAERITDTQKLRLSELKEMMLKFPIDGVSNISHDHHKIYEWLKIDQAFHATIYEAAKNQKAQNIVENLNTQWHRLESGLLAMEGRIKQNIEEHQAITEAITDNKAEEAQMLMKNHLTSLKHMVETLMKAFSIPYEKS